jgi:hypothetical protein
VDSRPAGVDSGPTGVESGSAGLDSGPAGVDLGPAGVDLGAAGVDSGPAGGYSGPAGGDIQDQQDKLSQLLVIFFCILFVTQSVCEPNICRLQALTRTFSCIAHT